MLVRLDLSTADRWTHLIGDFEILHGPVTSAIMAEAGHAAIMAEVGRAAIMAEAGHAARAESIEERTVEITRYLARATIRDWRGVVDEETGQPVPVTPATVDAVMDIWPIFRAFNERVIDARIRIDREKKDLPTSQNGTSGSVEPTAPTATDPAPTAPAA